MADSDGMVSDNHYGANQMIASEFNHSAASFPVSAVAVANESSLATWLLVETCVSAAITFNQTHFSTRSTTDCSHQHKMAEGVWHWWLDKIGSLLIGSLGLFGNLVCFVVFSTSKTFKCSSYISYLKFLSLVDAFCLLIESIKSLNDILIHQQWGSFYLYDKSERNCKLIAYFTSTFHLTSAWIICAFSMERCMVVVFPFYNRRTSTMRKTNLICMFIFLFALLIQLIRLLFPDSSCWSAKSSRSPAAASLNVSQSSSSCCQSLALDELEKLLLKFYSYFNQLICLVIIPSLIIITCNSIVFLRIIQRIRMVNSGNFHNNFKINKSSIPKIQVSKFVNGNGDSIPSSNGRPECVESPLAPRHNSNTLINNSLILASSITASSQGNLNRLKASTSLATCERKNDVSRLEMDSFATNDDELHSYSYSFSTTQHDDVANGGRYALANASQEVSVIISAKSGANLDLTKKTTPKKRSLLSTRRTKKSIQRSNRNRDIRLALLMLFSASMLFFVLPESMLNIYRYNTVHYPGQAEWQRFESSSKLPTITSSSSHFTFKCVNVGKASYYYFYEATKLSRSSQALIPAENQLELSRLCLGNLNKHSRLLMLMDMFHLLKIINYSSNFLAYLALLKFGKGRRPAHRKIERSSNLK